MTPNKEDYLKCIYEIGTDTEKITNKEIAQRMAVSPPAVTEMVKKLLAENFLTKSKEKGYLLTELGMQLTSELYRKHRLIELFLVHHLGYTANEIHEEAEVLEHTVSEHFIDRLNAMLGYPTTCPHGGTIPQKGELLVEQYQKTLAQVTHPGIYQLTRVHDDFHLLHYLEQQNLKIGDQLELIRQDPFSQTYHIYHKNQELLLNTAIAKQLYVQKY